MVDFVVEMAKKMLGEESIKTIDPVMGGEDFSYFLQTLHGSFLFFGMGDGMKFHHHHPAFDLDEKVLPQAVMLMTSLVLEF